MKTEQDKLAARIACAAIEGMMLWDEQPEGFHFWYDLSQRLRAFAEWHDTSFEDHEAANALQVAVHKLAQATSDNSE